MTRASLREYAAVQRERYQQATRAEKRQLLDEVVAVTGIHRKAAIRLLRRAPRPRADARARRPPARATAPRWPPPPRSCGRPAAGSAPIACTPSCPNSWTASSGAANSRSPRRSRSSCGRPAAPRSPACWGPPGPSTRGAARRSRGPGSVLKHEIPIRTFTEWTDARPGFCEVDLVAHCGSQHRGLLSLHPLRGGHRHRVGRARARLGQGPGARPRRHPSRPHAPARAASRPRQRQRLRVHQPRACYTYCRRHADHLHAQPPLEEKRQCPRRAEERRRRPPLVGYDRFASRAAYAQLHARLPPRPAARQLLPAGGEARDARPATARGPAGSTTAPRRRTSASCATGVLTPETRRELEALYQSLNPLHLRRELERELDRLWALAAPDPTGAPGNTEIATPLPHVASWRRLDDGSR